jgi:hypothetical protein
MKKLIIMNTENKFTQLCVWPGVVLEKENGPGQRILMEPEEFEEEVTKMFGGVRIKYKCEQKTLPDLNEDGTPDPETGGRNDVFFYVHTDDIESFAVPRLKAGIRWWEDVVGYNDNTHLYTEEFLEENPLTW